MGFIYIAITLGIILLFLIWVFWIQWGLESWKCMYWICIIIGLDLLGIYGAVSRLIESGGY